MAPPLVATVEARIRRPKSIGADRRGLPRNSVMAQRRRPLDTAGSADHSKIDRNLPRPIRDFDLSTARLPALPIHGPRNQIFAEHRRDARSCVKM